MNDWVKSGTLTRPFRAEASQTTDGKSWTAREDLSLIIAPMKDNHEKRQSAMASEATGRDAGPSEDWRFIADVNVGKLAKWLRILGYDTLFINPIDDDQLVEIGRQEGRVVLTKDTHISERRVVTSGQVRVVIVQGDHVAEQIRFLADHLGLRDSVDMLTRCIECNAPLEPIERSRVEGAVPPYVWKTQDRYVTCPRCGKIYWAGTHWDRMHRTAKQVLGDRD